MRHVLFAVFDTASGVYDGPFRAMTDAEAKRNFANLVRNPETRIGQNPEDFYLVRCGVWDDNKGQVSPEEPETLVTALELVSEQRRENGA